MAFIFEVKVVPSSGCNKWVLDKSGRLKCYLKNQPEDGKANKELVQLIAKVLKITQSEVVIIAGATHRNKKIQVACDITYDYLLAAVGVERELFKQGSLFE